MGYYQHPDRACYLPFYHCTIDHNGNVVACCHMREGDGLVGNLLDGPLTDLLASPAATDMRRKLTSAVKPDPCLDCAMQIIENQAIDRLLKPVETHASAS
jgi:radical SAM protein with 4Fe4S-binding SPASM domain